MGEFGRGRGGGRPLVEGVESHLSSLDAVDDGSGRRDERDEEEWEAAETGGSDGPEARWEDELVLGPAVRRKASQPGSSLLLLGAAGPPAPSSRSRTRLQEELELSTGGREAEGEFLSSA